ncbi:hypothetical protein [Paenibacillus sp. UMB4589-SE434]|uniref:hypothetical protein n=1 Tax=Paenibacillus sp. UMB4589-SE434 TaxID=3046314 RepID=UPI00254D346E|nr:hypothetical protein [Paenibacillus sp. UMB4589-SE434]MDK8179220.1 hypothetical protein [Paenibacillus sp. UMB4589-SE434]
MSQHVQQDRVITYDMSYSRDERYREVATNPEQMRMGVAAMIAHYEKTEDEITAGRISIYLRILGELDEGEKYARLAIGAYREEKRPRGVYVNKIRLARILHWKGEYNEAADILLYLKTTLEREHIAVDLLDLIYYVTGEVKVDQGHYKEALSFLKEAKRLGEIKKDHEALAATVAAIARAERLLSDEVEC